MYLSDTNKYNRFSPHGSNRPTLRGITATALKLRGSKNLMEYTVNIELNKKKPEEKISKIVFLDTETTGLSETDKIIELGLISCSCCLKTGRLLSIDKTYTATEDPGHPLNEKIIELTGLTDEQIQDTNFNEEEIKKFLRGARLIVSHNAAFDRPFFERRFPRLKNLSWGCTLNLEWNNYLPGSKRSLASLMNSSGYTFTAHRAVNDALAVIWLMYVHPEAFKDLLSTVKNGWSKVILQIQNVTGSIFKELIRSAYKPSTDRHYWYRFIPQTNEDLEFENLSYINERFKNTDEDIFRISIENFNNNRVFSGD